MDDNIWTNEESRFGKRIIGTRQKKWSYIGRCPVEIVDYDSAEDRRLPYVLQINQGMGRWKTIERYRTKDDLINAILIRRGARGLFQQPDKTWIIYTVKL